MTGQLLDKKDYAILRELDSDVRASYTEIGKRTRLSKEVVQYRVKQLEQRGIITGYWAHINLGSTYSVYKVLIKNRSLGKAKREELASFTLSQSVVSWFSDTEGNYDYVMTIIVNDEVLFAHFVQDLFAKFGSSFQMRHILKSTAATITNEKYLYPAGELTTNQVSDFLKPVPERDKVDDILLRALSLNSRASYAELGVQAKLTPEAIAYRMKHTLPPHISGLKVRIDYQKLGLSYYHVFVGLQDQPRRSEIIQYYTAHQHCVAIMHHLGYYDLHLEFVLPSEQIEIVMDELRAKFGDSLASYELLHIRKEHTMHMLR